LEKHPAAAVRVFVVWEPIIPTDFARPTTGALGRTSDRRVQQYWDRGHVLAARMAADARAPQPEQDCCVRKGVLWDLAAVYPKGATWGDRMPTATVFSGPVVDIIEKIDAALTEPSSR
jgi:hypothetical protein